MKLEVVPTPHTSSDLVLHTLKAGEDTMARAKSSQKEALEQQEGSEYSVSHNLYNMERPSAIISRSSSRGLTARWRGPPCRTSSPPPGRRRWRNRSR